MRALVTGCAGFVGSHVTEYLLKQGHDVVGIDNLSTGHRQFLQNTLASPRFKFILSDLKNRDVLNEAMQGVDLVFHFAANADIRFGLQHPHKDLSQNTLCTFYVLEAMRAQGVKRILFSSTGSVYGEATVIPTPENAPFPVQTSLYAASKLAAESLIQAYCEGFGMQGYIFRFVSLLGERYTHGHVRDFYDQLCAHPDTLNILGDGQQKKSYLYIHDCISAMFTVLEKSHDKVNVFNLGHDSYCTVEDSVRWICDYLGLMPARHLSGGTRGWVGDNPFIFLDCTRLRNLGWKPTLTIREGVEKTLQFLQENSWILVSQDSGTPVT